MYAVEWTRAARKQLDWIPQPMHGRILEKTRALSEDPRPPGAKALKGRLSHLTSIRAGSDYRVVYQIDDGRKLVTIVAVGPRGGVYDE